MTAVATYVSTPTLTVAGSTSTEAAANLVALTVEETMIGMTWCEARLVNFGHLGDGNLHYNLTQPVGADAASFLERWEEMNAIVHAVVMAHSGSISAEHGIGQLKRDLLPGVKDPVALDVMRMLKRTLDPSGILNPGKVLRQDSLGSE